MHQELHLTWLLLCVCVYHRCILNLIRKAMELVCGGSLIACVLVECNAQHSGKWKQQQQGPSLDQVRVYGYGWNQWNFLQLPVSTLQGPSTLWDPPDQESYDLWPYSFFGCKSTFAFKQINLKNKHYFGHLEVFKGVTIFIFFRNVIIS